RSGRDLPDSRTARTDRPGRWSGDRSGDDADRVGLGALRSLHHLELDALVLIEGLVAVGLDGRVVDEHVLATVLGDEAVALLVVEPLHDTLCHVRSLPVLPARTVRARGRRRPALAAAVREQRCSGPGHADRRGRYRVVRDTVHTTRR